MNLTYIWEHPNFKTSQMAQRMQREVDSERIAAAIIRDALVKHDGEPRYVETMNDGGDVA